MINFSNIILEKFKLKGISGITNANKSKERMIHYIDGKQKNFDDNYVIDTVGVNMYDIRNIGYIDINKVITNDIMVIYEVYGIDATKKMLVKELYDVYKTSGITVNIQIITLLADLMTHTGVPIPINRHGIMKLDNDPLSKASFETPIDQLVSSAIFNDKNKIKSVSSRIMVGTNIDGGTTMCKIQLNIDKLKKIPETIYEETSKDKFELIEDTFLLDLLNRSNISTFIPY